MGKIIRCNALRPFVIGKVWQYDFGQTLLIEGLQTIAEPVGVHFSVNENERTVTAVPGTVTEEGILAAIPDDLLRNNDIEHNYNLYVYIYKADSESGRTVASFVIPVLSGPRPDNYPAG